MREFPLSSYRDQGEAQEVQAAEAREVRAVKAEIMSWTMVSRMKNLPGRTVLLDGGLVTVRSMGPNVNETNSGGLARKGNKYKLDYQTPWGSLDNTYVRGDFMTAVIECDPGIKDQEGS
jgi:hypothetical protein